MGGAQLGLKHLILLTIGVGLESFWSAARHAIRPASLFRIPPPLLAKSLIMQVLPKCFVLGTSGRQISAIARLFGSDGPGGP